MSDQQITLRDAIRQAFPPVPYAGQITNCDGAWLPELNEENAIHDDDMFVYEALKDRRWPEVDEQFLHQQPGGFVLLTEDAFLAYVAAWLMASLNDMTGENAVRDYLVYSFAPPEGVQTDTPPSKSNRIRALNLQQQSVLRTLMAEFARSERSAFVRDLAAKAVEWIDCAREQAR